MKSNFSVGPPWASLPGSGRLLLSRSEYACALLPCVVVNSGPVTPLVSCHPNGEANASAGLVTNVRSPSFGSCFGNSNTR